MISLMRWSSRLILPRSRSGVRGSVRSADGRCPGDHEVPRASASPPSPVASTSSTKVTASHGFHWRETGFTTPRQRRAHPRAPGAGPHGGGEHRAADEQGHRLAGDERVAEQRRRDREPGAPEQQHHGAGQRAEQLPGARTSSCAPSYHFRPRTRRRSPAALAASEPLRSTQTASSRVTEPNQGYAATRPPHSSAPTDEQRRPPGPFGERRPALLGRAPAAAAGAVRGSRSMTVWCSVSSLVPSAPTGWAARAARRSTGRPARCARGGVRHRHLVRRRRRRRAAAAWERPAAAASPGSRRAWAAARPRGRGSRRGAGAAAPGMPERSCSPRRTRSMIAIDGPRPNGGWPVAAKATVAAHECTSEAVVASSPYRISGAR